MLLKFDTKYTLHDTYNSIKITIFANDIISTPNTNILQSKKLQMLHFYSFSSIYHFVDFIVKINTPRAI